MSISKRVPEALRQCVAGDFEAALVQICAPIEATAKAESGSGGRRSYRDFIDRNMVLITRFGFGGTTIGQLRVKYHHPELTPDSEDGLVSFQDIVYHVVRCGLYHEAELPETLTFDAGNSIRVREGKLSLPGELVIGLIVAVVASPANGHRQATNDFQFQTCGRVFRLSELWGRRDDLLQQLDPNGPG